MAPMANPQLDGKIESTAKARKLKPELAAAIPDGPLVADNESLDLLDAVPTRVPHRFVLDRRRIIRW